MYLLLLMVFLPCNSFSIKPNASRRLITLWTVVRDLMSVNAMISSTVDFPRPNESNTLNRFLSNNSTVSSVKITCINQSSNKSRVVQYNEQPVLPVPVVHYIEQLREINGSINL